MQYQISTYSSSIVSLEKETQFIKMLSLNIPSYTPPSGYQLSELPEPEIHNSKDVIIKVHAASINPVDVKKADGVLKLALKDS